MKQTALYYSTPCNNNNDDNDNSNYDTVVDYDQRNICECVEGLLLMI